MKFLLGLLAIFGVLSLKPLDVQAIDKRFSSNYEVKYEIDNGGITQVNQKITFTNLTEQYFISDYNLSVASANLRDVQAYADNQSLPVEATVQSGKTNIHVKIEKQLVGLNKTQTMNLKYQTPDFVAVYGQVMEVNLPQIIGDENIDSYNVTLSVPESFNDPGLVFPKPKSETQILGERVFKYTQNELSSNAVSLIFGQSQTIEYSLNYNLTNTNFWPSYKAVFLPPDNAYQETTINSIQPKPENVTKDLDGNILAWFPLAARSGLNVKVSGMAKLYSEPKTVKLSNSKADLDKYLANQTFWESETWVVKSALKQAFNDREPKTNQEKIKLIYNFLISLLKYSPETRSERLGGATALTHPGDAHYLEFADAFVSLARAAGVPSRVNQGFVLSKNSLHAWPEYFDNQKGWVMVDPFFTEASGGVNFLDKFDLNHFTLNVLGISSIYPPQPQKPLVTISQNKFLAEAKLEAEFPKASSVRAGLPSKYKIRVRNLGNASSPPQKIKVVGANLALTGAGEYNLVSLPAFGFADLELDLKAPNLWQEGNASIYLYIGADKFSQNLMIFPLLTKWEVVTVGLLFAFISAGLYGIILSSHLVKQRKKRS